MNFREFLFQKFNHISEAKKRDYKGEYKKWHSKPSYRKKRAALVQLRREGEDRGIVKKGDKMDLDHKKAVSDGGSLRSWKNIRVLHRSKNRAKDNN